MRETMRALSRLQCMIQRFVPKKMEKTMPLVVPRAMIAIWLKSSVHCV